MLQFKNILQSYFFWTITIFLIVLILGVSILCTRNKKENYILKNSMWYFEKWITPNPYLLNQLIKFWYLYIHLNVSAYVRVKGLGSSCRKRMLVSTGGNKKKKKKKDILLEANKIKHLSFPAWSSSYLRPGSNRPWGPRAGNLFRWLRWSVWDVWKRLRAAERKWLVTQNP